MGELRFPLRRAGRRRLRSCAGFENAPVLANLLRGDRKIERLDAGKRLDPEHARCHGNRRVQDECRQNSPHRAAQERGQKDRDPRGQEKQGQARECRCHDKADESTRQKLALGAELLAQDRRARGEQRSSGFQKAMKSPGPRLPLDLIWSVFALSHPAPLAGRLEYVSGGATATPSRRKRSRIRRAIPGAPGVSPCRQIVSASTSTREPSSARTNRSRARCMACSAASSGSVRSAPFSERGTSVPSARYRRSAKASAATGRPASRAAS